MAGLNRHALILGVFCAAGTAAVLSPSRAEAAFQSREAAATSDTVSVDSLPELHARMPDPRLDSLRVRAARFRAAITRLRVRFDVRVRRVESGLRFELPYPVLISGRERGEDVNGPLARLADLARRYYPSASINVLGTVEGAEPHCGSDAERSRAQEIVERFRQRGGLDPERIRRAECGRAPLADGPRPPRARADSVLTATIHIEWDSSDGTS